MSEQQKLYQENYEKLRIIAEKLSNEGEVDIDELVPLVDEATKAYQICKSRIEAVEKALSERLGQLETTDD
jgi:exodeoxyribonuclease VII small subunit